MKWYRSMVKKRQELKRLRELNRLISDEVAHIMGHKNRVDRLKQERDSLLNLKEIKGTRDQK